MHPRGAEEYEAPHAGRGGRFGEPQRAERVHCVIARVQVRRRLAQHVRARGEMDDRVDARERRAPIGVGADVPDRHGLSLRRQRGGRSPGRSAHPAAVGDQPAEEGAPDEPGRAGDEDSGGAQGEAVAGHKAARF